MATGSGNAPGHRRALSPGNTSRKGFLVGSESGNAELGVSGTFPRDTSLGDIIGSWFHWGINQKQLGKLSGDRMEIEGFVPKSALPQVL